MPVDLSVVIINFNTKDLTLSCVESILKNTNGVDFEIILIDNSSPHEIPSSKKYKLISSKTNLGFTGGNNEAMKASKGRYVLLINSDTLVHDNVLGEMVSWMDENLKIGIASSALRNKDGSVQGTGGYFPTLLRVFTWMTIQDFPFVDKFVKPFHPSKEKSFSKNDEFYMKGKELDWVTGAFMMIRREVINDIGYFDSEYFMYTEDTDYCYRAKEKGWKIYFNPKWSITHLGGASSIKEYPIISEYKNVKLFYKKHYPNWQYVPLRILLKIGALGRIIILGTMRGGEYARIYSKAFREA